MAKEIKLSASKRETSGTASAKALRRTGFVPAVVYGEKATCSIKINGRAFDSMITHHSSENLIVDLDIDGEVTKALLREVQHDVIMGAVLHADFMEISMTKKMRVTITIELKGEPVGVSQQGGILEHLLRQIEVECLPGDLVESFEVDVSELGLGKTMMIRDIKLDPKYTVLTSGDVAVATVVVPREEKVDEAVAAAAAAAAPEVIGKKKEEGAVEGAAPAKGAAAPAKAAAAPAKAAAAKPAKK